VTNLLHYFLGARDTPLATAGSGDGAGFHATVASPAVSLAEDYVIFPKVVLLPLGARGVGVPGMTERPWSRLSAEVFCGGSAPVIYSVSIQREAPDTMRSNLRARRTLMEGLLLAAAEKTGRRPSMAEKVTDTAMDAAESSLALGKPIFKASLLAALYAARNRFAEVETVRRTIEANMKAMGLIPQRLFYIVERALHYLQPGGQLCTTCSPEDICFRSSMNRSSLPRKSFHFCPNRRAR